jgi:predicted nucleotidyltransferase
MMGNNSNKSINIFETTNLLKVLSYITQDLSKEFLASEIQKATLVSRAGVYFALKELMRQKIVLQERRGKVIFYRIVYDDAIVKQFKILKNVFFLRYIIAKLKPFSRKIMLYGSYSRGENDLSSDVDLFIISKDPEATKEAVSSIKTKQKLQTVIKTASEMADFKENEKVFMQEVERGIVLWEEKV